MRLRELRRTLLRLEPVARGLPKMWRDTAACLGACAASGAPQPQQCALEPAPPASHQYVSIRYSERLAEAGIEPSVGSIGDSYDNALAETVHGLFKTELIRRRGPWRSFDAVEFATLEWVDWFNNRRILEPIGNMPPAEAEERYYAQIEEVPLAA